MLKKMAVTGLITWVVLSVVLSYLLVGSLNPFSFFYANINILAKIVIAFSLLLAILSLINLLNIIGPMGKQECPICNHNLLKFVNAYGKPQICWSCLREGRITYYHEKCYRAMKFCPLCKKNEIDSIFLDNLH